MTRGRVHAVVGIVVVGGLALWPWITRVPQYSLTRWEYIFAGLMVAIGLNIVTGFAGQLSLGPGAVYAIAGYAAALLADRYAPSIGIVAMCAIAVGVAAVIGLVIGVPSLRVGGFYLAMTTLFFALIVPVVASNWTFAGKERGVSLIANIDFTQRWTGIGLYEMSLAVVVALLVGSWWLLESRAGRRFVTLATSEQLASSIGIAGYRTKLLAFVLSALPAGLGGAFYVYTQQFMAPGSVSPQLSIYLVAACVIGGFGTVLGPFVGGLLILGLSQYLGRFEQYEGIIFGVLLIVFSVALPEGLMGFRPGALRTAQPWRRALHIGAVRVDETERVAPRPDSEPVRAIHADVSRIAPMLDGPDVPPLRVESVSRSFGGVRALNAVDLVVWPGTVHGLIGSNGSGKTTLLNVISGFVRPDRGAISLGDVRLSGRSPHVVASRGVSRTFQTPKLIESATLLRNVAVAAEQRSARGSRLSPRSAQQVAVECLAAVGLADRALEEAASQPHGTQRLVEVARALATRPAVVLLDEPGAGLSAAEIDVLRDVIVATSHAGTSILLVEHNVPLVLDVADEVTALHEGTRIALGTPAEVTAHPEVVRSFIGAGIGAER